MSEGEEKTVRLIERHLLACNDCEQWLAPRKRNNSANAQHTNAYTHAYQAASVHTRCPILR